MKKVLMMIACLALCSLSLEAKADSYKLHGDSAAKFNHAVDLLNNYGGKSADLDMAKEELDETIEAMLQR